MASVCITNSTAPSLLELESSLQVRSVEKCLTLPRDNA